MSIKFKIAYIYGRIKGSNYLLKLLKRKYFISFIEEFWLGRATKYIDWKQGRMEVYDNFGDSPYAIDEIRFCNNADDWYKFREEWDFRDISEKKLKEVTKLIKQKYYKLPK